MRAYTCANCDEWEQTVTDENPDQTAGDDSYEQPKTNPNPPCDPDCEVGTPQTIKDGSVNPNFSGVLRSKDIPNAEPELLPDPLAVALGSECGSPEGYISFKGFLSEPQPCASGKVHRLYTDDTFWTWLEIRANDIRAQIAVPPDGYDPRSVIWVRREAKVTRCKVSEAYDLVEEVFGLDPGGITVRPPYR